MGLFGMSKSEVKQSAARAREAEAFRRKNLQGHPDVRSADYRRKHAEYQRLLDRNSKA